MPTKITTTAQKRTRKATKFVDSEAEESECDGYESSSPEFDESSIEYSDSEFDDVKIHQKNKKKSEDCYDNNQTKRHLSNVIDFLFISSQYG